MGRLGMPEIILILAVFIILFGARKLPEIGNALGRAIKEFKKAGREIEQDVTEAIVPKENEKKS